ncbi:Trypsin-like peptidase domain-containing protein, partial [Dysosmobacter welbionis]
HVLLGNQAGEHGHSEPPGAEAQRSEHKGNGRADSGQNGVVHILHHAEGAVLPAEALEEPQHDGGGQDHRAGPLDEGPPPLPGGPQHIARRGGVVGGQLHDEGRRVAGEHLGLFQDDAGDDDGRHADKVGGHGHQRASAEQGAGDHADDGHLSAAGDEAGGHDRHAAVPLVLNGPRGHDAGDTAAGAHQHGDEALAGEAELPEDPVHDEGDSRHVADVLQNGQHQEQHQHLGHEAQHRADTGQGAVANQAHDHFVDAPALQGGTGDLHQPGSAQHIVGPVRQEGAEGTHGDPIHREHHHGEDGQGQDPVGDDLVDLVGGGEAMFLALLLDGLRHQIVDVRIPLVGDDALRVVIQLLLAVHDVVLQVGPEVCAQVQVRQDLLIPLKDLHRVPAEISVVHHTLDGLLDVGDGVLHAAREHVGQFSGALLLGHLGSQLRSLHAALALQGADLHHLAAQGV